MSTTLGERIKAYREQLGISQKELAERSNQLDKTNSNWGQPRIANYEKGNRTPNLDDIKILGKVLNVDPQVLAFDTNVEPIKIVRSREYPLLSKVQAGLWTGIDYLQNIDEGFEFLSTNTLASENAFFLQISGQSMETRFHEGDLVLIDPDLAPTPGKFVAAVNGDGEATFKKYKELGTFDEWGSPHFELVPLNDVFPTLSSLNQEIRIIGVAVEHRQGL
ncbi:repressor [Rodentibacter caecimuris]|uniref:LexA family transcriptional regulator n=2 Tax=Rodentibacter caecimuris TaxID=1796644 RepID=UPI0007507738|nr:S24 family peptidase [Rodentibacter heylii]OOF72958.1 repressor [Rodentibacter heylii]QIA76149.1 helix-turn-helix domain-containing protein [Rodentibacter heylii]